MEKEYYSTIKENPDSLSENITNSTKLLWSPGARRPAHLHLNIERPAVKTEDQNADNGPSPIWQPFGAPVDVPQFRKICLEASHSPKTPPASTQDSDKQKNSETSVAEETTKGQLVNNPNAKSGHGLNLPAYQSPTIVLLQKAREGQLPKGAKYIEDKIAATEAELKNASKEKSEGVVCKDEKDSENVSIKENQQNVDSVHFDIKDSSVTTHIIKAPSKYDGIGPTEYGIPVGLRTGVKEEYASDWYKTMYRSLHKARNNSPGQTVHLGGYMSEPEFDHKDDFSSKHSNFDHHRKIEKRSMRDTSSGISSKMVSQNLISASNREQEPYHNQPRSIADYEPGHSSLADQEFQKFWDDFWDSLDDLNEHLRQDLKHQPSYGKKWSNVLCTDGYESDSTLIRKSGRPAYRADPEQQRAWYKAIQKGGEIPFTGLGKLAPEKPKTSTHQYQETEVNIHYRSPIRNLEKEYIDEEELQKKQEEAMRRFYEEERQKKQLQQMAEIEMRRHSDFFTPSQKSPIPLNRYDNPFECCYQGHPVGTRGSEPRTLAKVLYPFTAQITRELSLNKGDIVYINKQIDSNWYEGEHHGLVGIFPVSYVEVIPQEQAGLQPRKAAEGLATAKYNFRAQSPAELSLFKGENVILTRRVDHNWYEGRIGSKKGIFPTSYVNVHKEPGEFGERSPVSPKPPASPVFSAIVNGSSLKTPQGPTFNTGLSPSQCRSSENVQQNKEDNEKNLNLMQSLHVDTYNEPIPYRSLYAYYPQNADELELHEGDTVYVMEKCDDGWYVGTSLRTGLFGTFPGNYVERI